MRVQCCSCHAMKQLDGSFKHEEGIDKNVMGVSHGLCPTCLDKELERFRQYKLQKARSKCGND